MIALFVHTAEDRGISQTEEKSRARIDNVSTSVIHDSVPLSMKAESMLLFTAIPVLSSLIKTFQATAISKS